MRFVATATHRINSQLCGSDTEADFARLALRLCFGATHVMLSGPPGPATRGPGGRGRGRSTFTLQAPDLDRARYDARAVKDGNIIAGMCYSI